MKLKAGTLFKCVIYHLRSRGRKMKIVLVSNVSFS